MRPWMRTCLDLVLIVVFSMIGRASHGEWLSPGGIATTAWPFLVAGLLGSLVAGRLLSASWLKEGLAVWLTTAVLGLLLRAVTGGGMAVAFLIVATTTLGLLLVGWRLVASRIRRPA